MVRRATLRCMKCNFHLGASESQIGKAVHCPRCQQKLTISREFFDDPQQKSAKPTATNDGGTADEEASRDSETDSRSIGQFGRFDLKKVLGEGAFGKVYLAHDPVLDRQVALKIPTFDTRSRKRTRRFLTEARSAAQLTHPEYRLCLRCRYGRRTVFHCVRVYRGADP